jgi:NadR type nicotinamide-nucleotide adenylyltransferase
VSARVPTVCLFGPESTGKTTLARELAARFGTFFVPEYGRFYCEAFGHECDVEDLRAILRGQRALEEAGRRKAGRLLILDTDGVMTSLWADKLLDSRPGDLEAAGDGADLYLLAQVDVPFEQDQIRYYPGQAEREEFFAQCQAELERRNLRYVVVSGDHEKRLETALAAIEAHLGVTPN